MLFLVLVVSSLHLGWTNLLSWLKQDTMTRLVGGALPLVFVGVALTSLPLLVQAAVLALLTTICSRYAPRKPLLFFVSSVPTVALLLMIDIVAAAWFERSQIAQFPFESMAKRVPAPKPVSGQKPTDKNLSDLEECLEPRNEENHAWSRTSMLRSLHENATDQFIWSQGFGVMRMPYVTPERINRTVEEQKPVAQPETYVPYPISTDDLDRPALKAPAEDLRRLHFYGVIDFVNPKGFGYVKDREHVAGFIPHQFSTAPSEPRLRRLELVSLLMHAKPVIYVSNELPRMGDLKYSHTRSLNEFEAKGLAALEDGEDLFVRETPDALLMMGAIRSVKQCVQCHGGERGDLLGAFSYCLTVGR